MDEVASRGHRARSRSSTTFVQAEQLGTADAVKAARGAWSRSSTVTCSCCMATRHCSRRKTLRQGPRRAEIRRRSRGDRLRGGGPGRLWPPPARRPRRPGRHPRGEGRQPRGARAHPLQFGHHGVSLGQDACSACSAASVMTMPRRNSISPTRWRWPAATGWRRAWSSRRPRRGARRQFPRGARRRRGRDAAAAARPKSWRAARRWSLPRRCFSATTRSIGKDVVIEPHVVIGERVVIEDGAAIKSFCYMEKSRIGPGATVGPVRPAQARRHARQERPYRQFRRDQAVGDRRGRQG